MCRKAGERNSSSNGNGNGKRRGRSDGGTRMDAMVNLEGLFVCYKVRSTRRRFVTEGAMSCDGSRRVIGHIH